MSDRLVETPADATDQRAAAPAGPTERQLRDVRFCGHGWLTGGCIYCADPLLEHKMLRDAEALLREHGDLP